jgi:3-deoxy-manno-octulosonate cytidylyltransferase (CMP-KDO synthetase)
MNDSPPNRAAPAAVPFVVGIPARLKSTRLAEKVLADINGRPLIAHVVEIAKQAGAARVFVATDHLRIAEVVQEQGIEVVMTPEELASGSDRLAFAAKELGLADDTLLVNLQGDEPLMPFELLQELAALLNQHPDMAMASVRTPIREVKTLFSPNVVKVVVDAAQRALYFSRWPIPFHRESFRKNPDQLPEFPHYYRHLGMYAYRVGALKKLAALPPCETEQAESLEQLRALHNGLGIVMLTHAEPPPHGVDTPDDLARVRKILAPKAEPEASLRPKPKPAPIAKSNEPPLMKVLFVCMGNICRSPMAEGLFRQYLDRAGLAEKVVVDSAGTHSYHVDDPPDPRAIATGQRHGFDITGLRGRQLTADDFSTFDYVLVMDRNNLREAKRIAGRNPDNLKLLREYALDQTSMEVADPYGGPDSDFEVCRKVLDLACRGLMLKWFP